MRLLLVWCRPICTSCRSTTATRLRRFGSFAHGRTRGLAPAWASSPIIAASVMSSAASNQCTLCCDYAFVPVWKKARLWMTYSGTDWRVARYPVGVFCLVGTAAGGAIMRVATCAVLASACCSTLQFWYLAGTHADSAGRAGQEKHSRHARCRQGAGETFPLHIAIKKQPKQSRAELADRLQRVDSASASSSDEADALLESLKRS